MRVKINLSFLADVESEAEAWEIAEHLEKAAIKRDYTAISTWVTVGTGREGALGPESDPVTSSAERMERHSGLTPTAVGDMEGVLTPLMPGTVPQD